MDQNKLYVGNLSYDVNNESLTDMFKEFGEVTEAVVIVDRETNRSKGFGFVTFTKEEDAAKAIKELDGKELDGRSIKVNVAKPRESR
jgi:RNA recognition motif-containing protein